MTIQTAERHEKHGPRQPRRPGVDYQLYPTANTFSGTDGSRLVNCATGGGAAVLDATAWDMWISVYNTGTLPLAGAMTVAQVVVVPATGDEEEYNPEMVTEILRADAEHPEAKFNNVVKMLDWLNRD